MVQITAPVKGFKGVVAGVTFAQGKGETDDPAALAYFRRKGYGVDGAEPTGKAARSAPADPRKVAQTRRGTAVRDAAVQPESGDFLEPVNAGEENPHGPEVVNPELHASQGVRPVKGGPVHVDDAKKQDAAEKAHLKNPVAGQAPVGDPDAEPAGNAPKADWQTYARSLGATDEDLKGKTRDQLRATYGSA